MRGYEALNPRLWRTLPPLTQLVLALAVFTLALLTGLAGILAILR
jgi:hypothetical protein